MLNIKLNNKSEDYESDSSSSRIRRAKVKKPSLYRVILLNDDYTPMEFVIYVLQTFFSYDKEKATQIMLAVIQKERVFVVFIRKK